MIHRIAPIFLALVAGGVLAGCGSSAPRFVAPREMEGVASYYAEEFNGRKTANGEVYDMHALTAAHRTLPFNTKLRVSNLNNGRSVIVRVNDRGPFKESRILDLSLEAARRLGITREGTARVKIEIVELGSTGE